MSVSLFSVFNASLMLFTKAVQVGVPLMTMLYCNENYVDEVGGAEGIYVYN
jgi:hypothetical protein